MSDTLRLPVAKAGQPHSLKTDYVRKGKYGNNFNIEIDEDESPMFEVTADEENNWKDYQENQNDVEFDFAEDRYLDAEYDFDNSYKLDSDEYADADCYDSYFSDVDHD